MAEQTFRTCDVYGSTRNVRRVTVTVEVDGCYPESLMLLPALAGNEADYADRDNFSLSFDASPRAYKRLVKFILKGMGKPANETK